MVRNSPVSLRWVTLLLALVSVITAVLVTAAPAQAATTVAVDDGVLTGTDRFTYSGSSWTTCGGCNTGSLGNSYRYAYTTGDYATLTFTGTAASITGFNEPAGGIAAVSLDGGPTTDVDLYNPTTRLTAVYTTPALTNGTHTVRITVTGRRAAGAAAAITIDKADITAPDGSTVPATTTPPTTSNTTATTPAVSTPPVTTSTSNPTSPPPVSGGIAVDDGVLTGSNRFAYAGASWKTCGGCNTGALNNSFRYANTPGDSATLTFSGTAATITGFNEPAGGIAAVAVDGGPTTDVNLYNPTTRITAIYTSPTLANGTHTITITATGRRATGAVAAAITIDKADVATSGGTAPTTSTVPTTTRPSTGSTGPATIPVTTSPTTTTPPAASSAMASITFDDGTAGHFTYARPALAQRGLKGTFYIVSDALNWGLASNLNATQVKAIAADGNEIGNHTRDHSNLSALSSADVSREFANSQAALQAQIGVTPTTCAYPYGSHNAGVDAIAAQYFRGCRETGGGLNTLAGLKPFALTNYYVTATTTASDVQAAIGRAKAANAWIIFTYHGIDPGATGEAVTPANFSAQLDAIKGSGITVRTVSAALTVYGR